MLQLIKKHVCLVGKIYYIKNSRLFMIAAIMFVLLDIIYAVGAIGYTPTLRFSDDNTDIFVADVHNGRLYQFELNSDRTELKLSGSLEDKIANTTAELDGVIFGQGFGGITDLEVVPDGYLYVVSIGQGKIFRILPRS
jgi:hypothetical protein